jgi:hypothetical protein
MEGFKVTGTRMTKTIPVGAEGSDRALKSIIETWTSPEMGITLLKRRFDPRSGTEQTRMSNLQRTEPNPALFRVPPNYSIIGDIG